MARSLDATLQTALTSGGAIYWFVRLTKNTDDAWSDTYIVAGNIRTTSFSDTTIWTDSLLDISAIDNSCDIYSSAVASTADVSVSFDNSAAAITPGDYVGRVAEIYCGYGTTMSLATSELFFTGRVVHGKANKKDIVFQVRGKGELRNREIGERLPETVNEKYRGKVYPISYGDWTDSDAYLPLIVLGAFSRLPSIVFDKKPWKDFRGLWLYDEDVGKAYAVSDETQFTLVSDNNEVRFYKDTGATLGSVMAANQSLNAFIADDASLISYYKSTGSDLPAQTIIQVDGEHLLVVEEPDASDIVWVERGFNKTEIEYHAYGAPVYQLTEDISGLLIELTNTFWAKGFSGIGKEKANAPTGVFSHTPQQGTGLIENMKDGELLNTFLMDYTIQGDPDGGKEVVLMDLIFERIGISGTVINQYCVTKCQSYVLNTASSNFIQSKCILTKNGDWETDTDHIYFTAAFKSGAGSDIDGFDSTTDPVGTTIYGKTSILDLSDVSNLNSARYSIGYYVWHNLATGETGSGENEFYAFGFRIDFNVDPLEFDFYVRGECREQESGSGYYTGTDTNLMEEPANIIEDFCRQENGLVDADLDSTAFTAMETDRSAWKLAATIHSDMLLIEGL